MENLTGKKFGRWTVLKLSHIKRRSGGGDAIYWLCECECGTIKPVDEYHLNHGTSKSCGCLAKELSSKRETTHGLSHSRLYNIWQSIKKRCLNKKCARYNRYGGRGIIICQEWINDFMNFYKWAINNGYNDNLSIERIDNDGNYEPNNCKWANPKTQARNRSNNHLITYNGETHCIAEWAEIIGIDRDIIDNRLKKKWTIERIFTTPVKRIKSKRMQGL